MKLTDKKLNKNAPHIKGELEICIKTGIFKCHFHLSNLPEISQYRVLLNKGMNIKYFRDHEGNLLDYDGYYAGKTHHVGIEYHFLDSEEEDIEDLPTSFEIEYIGAYPIYKNEYNTFDFKGYIANNSETLRATEQSKWYPIIYDSINDRYIDSYSYELKITAKHSTSIFINGSAPKKGEVNLFKSSKPFPLFLFVGNFDFMSSGNNYMINASISKEVAKNIFKEIDKIKSTYATDLEIEFNDSIYIINHKAVEEIPEDSQWGFNVYPAFGFSGIDFNSILKDDGRLKCKYVDLFSHELAHNYFLTNVMSGKLYWFWLESCAEYMSFNITELNCGKKYLNQKLLDFVSKIEDQDYIPLEEITSPQEIDVQYRYILGPLILKCFEIRFGKSSTNKIFKSLLEISYTRTLTIEEWEEASVKNGIIRKEFRKFRIEFLKDDTFKANVINQINEYCQ